MHPSLTKNQSQFSNYAKMLMVSIIWGGTFIAGRHLGGTGSSLTLACLRFIFASLSLIIYLRFSNTILILPNKKQFLQLVLLGFLGVLSYNLFFFAGLSYTTASRASLIVTLNPAMIALISFLLFDERISYIKLLGIFFCVVGSGMIIISNAYYSLNEGSFWGDMFILGCVFSWSFYTVFSKGISKNIGPILAVSYSIFFGTIMLSILALTLEAKVFFDTISHLSISEIISIIFLGCVGSSLAYIWYYESIVKIGATRSGTFIALNPLTAIVLSSLLFDEHISIKTCIYGCIAILGVYLCNIEVSFKFNKHQNKC